MRRLFLGSQNACMRKRSLTLLFLFFGVFSAYSQKSIVAVKATTPVKIDGNIDEQAWQSAPVAKNFVQNFPTFGLPEFTKTEVRILYDDNAVYICAHLYDDPSLIRKQLTARDGENRQDVDHFSVFFDTYNDQQNGFQFLVTSANVQSDAKLGGSASVGFGEYGDKTWDAVWQSKAQITNDGWVVEMRIPYISLRFSKKDVQTWGLQFLRSTRRNNESAFWNPVDPNISGFLNQFGKYTDIQNILPPLRLSFSPYLSGGLRINPEGSTPKTEWLKSGGMDVKYGINESFTLDATLIPDFGQVVSDNIVNNLTPFEQRFTENRPFFTEGTELFNKSGLFYSRRIGATPTGYRRIQALYGGADDDFEVKKNPSVTRLYNAIKLSGRTQKKVGIGIFNAVTAPMNAQLENRFTKNDTSIRTEPLTNYNIIVVDKAFTGRSSVTFTNTNVTRNGAAHDANVAALDWALFNKQNKYALTGTARYSNTFGNRPYSRAYFMNTDTTTIRGMRYLNPYDGFSSKLRFSKIGGKLQYYAQVNVESDKYDPNDLGYIDAANEVVYTGNVSYNQFTPTPKFVTYNYNFNVRYQYLYKPYQFSQIEIQASGFWVFKNFWDVRLLLGGQPIWQTDFFDLQTKNYKVKKPWFYYTSASGSTDSRKRLFASFEAVFADGELDNSEYYKAQLGLRYRFSNKFTLGFDVERAHDKLQVGWAFIRDAQTGAPIVGYRDYKDINTITSATYNFNSRMNISLRGRHYWSKVHYLEFKDVDEKGNHLDRAFVGDMDQNFNLFNVDAFFTWDFRYGSRVIAGWKNFLGNNYAEEIDGFRYSNYIRNIGQTFYLPHGNEFSLRIIYFLDYNQLRGKR